VCAVLWAHGDLHERIAAVTERIAKSPRDAKLYFQRAELHREHEDWKAAWADYDEAARLDPALEPLDRCRGLLLLQSGRAVEAKPYLDRHLERRPDDGDGYLIRARALVETGSPLDASRDYTAAIERLPRVQPEHYVERARALVQAGPSYLPTAVRGLDEGIRRLGSNVALESVAADIEADLKRYDAALARVDRIAAQASRKEMWLARRGSILERAGRTAEARAAYETALKSIESLPPAKRRARATRELEESVRAAIARVPEEKAPEEGDAACSGG
jgi:predicted Zn-dependent protease